MVLANKCDLLERIDQYGVCQLETSLEEKFPEVMYRDISVVANVDV